MMNKSPLGILALGAMCLTTTLLAACTSTTPLPLPIPTDKPQPQADFQLPAPVYLLREGQIWRLEHDGITQRQITHEPAPVNSFDVSPVDGGLVYVSGNALIYADAYGENRQVLVAGPDLPVVTDDLAACNDKHHITGKISTPVWSPDGRRIAYIQSGLNVMTRSSGEVEIAHPNDVIPDQGEVTDRRVIASVISWSPDGQRLLVTTYGYPLRSLYYRDIAVKTLSGYLSTIKECFACTSAWSADSQTFYLGDPLWGGQDALSRCAVEDMGCTLIGLDIPARTAYFYAYPHVYNQDEIYVFMGISHDTGEPPVTFKLHRVQSDGHGTTELRTDEYAIQTALWANDHSGVLIVPTSPSGTTPPDSLMWLSVDGSPAVTLSFTGAQMLRWGHP